MTFIWKKPNWDIVESGVNVGRVEWRKGNYDSARAHYKSSAREYMKMAANVTNNKFNFDSKAEICDSGASSVVPTYVSAYVSAYVKEEEIEISKKKIETFNREVEDFNEYCIVDCVVDEEDDETKSLRKKITKLEEELESERNKLKLWKNKKSRKKQI